jgi:hypothetical protein
VNMKSILVIAGISVVFWAAVVVAIVGDLPAINPAFWFN